MTSRRKRKLKEALTGYLFLAPLLIGLGVFYVYSFFQNFYYSFTKFGIFGSPKWVGLANYVKLFNDSNFLVSLGNTVQYVLIGVPGVVLFSTIGALLLNSKVKGITFFRTALFIPAVTLPAAIGIVWRWLYHSKYGLVNAATSVFGMEPQAWLTDSNLVLGAISVVLIWSMVGTNMIILLAGLQNIDKSMYESARVEGANKRQILFKITLPLLSPTIFFVTIMASIGIFQIFDFIFLMIHPSAASLKHAQSLVYLFYKASFTQDLKGYGAAISIVIFFIILVITLIQFAVKKKWVHE